MSRQVTAVADQLIRSDVRMVQWVADLYFNGLRVEANLPIMPPKLDWDGNSQVIGSGQIEVVWADKWGRSRAPQGISDWLAPFGSELQVDVLMIAGSFTERVPIGRYVITSLPTIQDRMIPWRRDLTTIDRLVSATTITVEVRDQFHKVDRNRFAVPESPVTTSAWSEVQRLTGLPILRTADDAQVSRNAVYADSRLDTLDNLFDLMQAWPALTPTGALTARPYAWPAPVDVVLRPSQLVSSMDSANVYNHVVVEGKDEAGNPVRAQARITEGPLRGLENNGAIAPYGPATYFYTSDLINTVPQAQRTADRLLSEVSQRRGVILAWDEPFNPLREVGDVVWLGPALVRIITVGTDGTTTNCTGEMDANATGSYEKVYSMWMEDRRNMVPVSTPTAYAGSGWAAASGAAATPPGWLTSTLASVTTAYFFTDGAEELIQVGDEVTMLVTYRVDEVSAGSAATHVSVRPHRRTGNLYFPEAQVVTPITPGQIVSVEVHWTATVECAVGDLDLAIVSANSSGAFAAVQPGFKWGATNVLIERGNNPGALYFNGASFPTGEVARTRYLGAVNASPSVLETREVIALEWMPGGTA